MSSQIFKIQLFFGNDCRNISSYFTKINISSSPRLSCSSFLSCFRDKRKHEPRKHEIYETHEKIIKLFFVFFVTFVFFRGSVFISQNLTQKKFCSFIDRMAEKMFGLAFFHNRAVIHEDHPIRHFSRKSHFMRYDYHCHAFFGKVFSIYTGAKISLRSFQHSGAGRNGMVRSAEMKF